MILAALSAALPMLAVAIVVLLGVAAVALLIITGWLPNFFSWIPVWPFASVTNEVLLYVAELVGFYAFIFLLVALIGAPSNPRDYFGGAALIALSLFAYTAARGWPVACT